MTRRTPAEKRRMVNLTSTIVAFTVLGIVFIGLLVGEASSTRPPAISDQKTTTVVRAGDSFAPVKSTTVVKKSVAPDSSAWGRALANPASEVILDFVLALLVGYVAGAAVQRIALSYYALKLGDLEIDAVPEVAAEPAKQLADTIRVAEVNRLGGRVESEIPSPWWTQPPAEGVSAGVAIAISYTELQAGARGAVPGRMAVEPNFALVLGALDSSYVFSKGLADQLARLDSLGARAIAGAKFQNGADGYLLSAYRKAILQLWNYLKVGPVTSE